MEITRLTPVPRVASEAQSAPLAPPQAKAQAIKAQTVKAEVRQAKARQNVSDALAKAILAESNIEPTELQKFNVRLDIHKETGRVVAEIENKRTGELLQRIPSETILRGAVMLEKSLGTVLDTPA